MLKLQATIRTVRTDAAVVIVQAGDVIVEGPRVKWSTSWLDLAAELDSTYRVTISPSGIVFHDGRAEAYAGRPDKLNGSYLAMCPVCEDGWPGLKITTDKLGTVPVYFARSDREFFIATQIVEIAHRLPVRPDALGLWELVLFDVPLWDRTLLEEVKLLPPASEAWLLAGTEPRIRRYWSPPNPRDRRALPSDQVLTEELVARLRIAQGHTIPANAAAYPVTGGLDSRINLALHRKELDSAVLFHAYARGEPEGPIARRIADVLGKPLLLIPVLEAMLGIPDIDPARHSGELHASQLWLENVGKCLKAQSPASGLVDGYMQDVLFNPKIVDSGTSPSHGERAARTASYRYRLIGRDPTDSLMRGLSERLLDAYGVQSLSPLGRSQRYYLENRGRKYVFGQVQLTQNYLPVALAGIDNDLLDFGFSLPWELRNGASLYRAAIIQLAPDLANVRYDKTGLPLTSRRRKSLRLGAENAARGYLSNLWRQRPFLQDSECSVDEVIRKQHGLLQQIQEILRGSEWVCEMLGNRTDVDRLIARERTELSLGHLLSGMITIAKLEAQIKQSANALPQQPGVGRGTD